MMALLVSGLLMAAVAQAQTSRNCADSNAEVSACPGNYLPQVVIPSASDKQAVIDALAKMGQAVIVEDDAYKQLARIKSRIEGDPHQDGDYVKQLQVVQFATTKKYDLANDAIRLAVAAYSLTPPVGDFTGDPRAAALTTVKPWIPRYSEREIYDDASGRFRRRTPEELRSEAAKSQAAIGGAGNVAAARTWSKGEISMFDQAFQNPDDLATLIYHETSHWVDIAAKPGGGRDSDPPIVTFQSEADAYARSAKIAKLLGRNFSQMENLAAQYQLQAKESGGRSWEWVIVNRRQWLGTDRRGPLGMAPAEPETGSDGEAILRQKMAETLRQAKETRERQERLQKERQKEAERIEELARLERKAQAFRNEMDDEAAKCGYRITYDSDNKTMLGFSDRNGRFILGRYHVPFDFGDLKVVFLMARTCEDIEADANRPAPSACNGAASLLHERVGRGNFEPKLKYLTSTMGFAYSDTSECIKDLLANANRITDSKSFDKVAGAYQKRLSKRLAEDGKRARDRERRDRDRKGEGGGSPPQGGRDRDCFRNGDPFGCQPKHP